MCLYVQLRNFRTFFDPRMPLKHRWDGPGWCSITAVELQKHPSKKKTTARKRKRLSGQRTMILYDVSMVSLSIQRLRASCDDRLLIWHSSWGPMRVTPIDYALQNAVAPGGSQRPGSDATSVLESPVRGKERDSLVVFLNSQPPYPKTEATYLPSQV